MPASVSSARSPTSSFINSGFFISGIFCSGHLEQFETFRRVRSGLAFRSFLFAEDVEAWKEQKSSFCRKSWVQNSNRDLFRTNLATKSLFCYRSDNKKQNMQLKRMKPKKLGAKLDSPWELDWLWWSYAKFASICVIFSDMASSINDRLITKSDT